MAGIGMSEKLIHEVTVDIDFPMVIESTFKRLNRTSNHDLRELNEDLPWYRNYANRLAEKGFVLRYTLKPDFWGSPPKDGVTTYEHLGVHCASCPHYLVCQLYGRYMNCVSCKGCSPDTKWLHHHKEGNTFVLERRNPSCTCGCTGFITCPSCLPSAVYPVLLDRLSTPESYSRGNGFWIESSVVLQSLRYLNQRDTNILGLALSVKESHRDFALRGWDGGGCVRIARKVIDTKMNP